MSGSGERIPGKDIPNGPWGAMQEYLKRHPNTASGEYLVTHVFGFPGKGLVTASSLYKVAQKPAYIEEIM